MTTNSTVPMAGQVAKLAATRGHRRRSATPARNFKRGERHNVRRLAINECAELGVRFR